MADDNNGNPQIDPTGGMYGGPQINGVSPSAAINAGFAYGGESGAQAVNNQLNKLLTSFGGGTAPAGSPSYSSGGGGPAPNPYSTGIDMGALNAWMQDQVNKNQQWQDSIKQQLIDNEKAAQDQANKQAAQAQANWQAQMDATAKNNQNQLYSNMTNYLTNQLNSPMGPALVNTLNASLQGAGLPGVGTSAGEGVLPNAITPAEWDALPAAIQQQMLQAWQARGGDVKSFIASIDAQRPHGPQYTGGMVHYGNVAA